jgi:hypothetical protein
VYGELQGDLKSDLTLIEQNYPLVITKQHRMAKIKTCWNEKLTRNGQLKGIQLVLSNTDPASDIFMQAWGQVNGLCQIYVVPTNQFIKTVQLTYDATGMTAFSFITNKGEYRTYGYTSALSRVAKFSFSE